MNKLFYIFGLFCTLTGCAQSFNTETPVTGQWSKEKINAWYNNLPWLVGCNYYPSTAINQIEMWQASTWDSLQIEKELGWAEELGMNTLRVYLHDLVWDNDEEGLYKRMDLFLTMCQNHGIRPWFVFFDDCHHPNPILGVQPLPVRAYHNSGWNNCPSKDLTLRYAEGNATATEIERLKGYIQKTISRFKDDERVLMWELYNEPGRAGRGEKSNQLVYDTWVWAREINPSQPITSTTAGSVGANNIKINRINSDLHSIHTYSNLTGVKGTVNNYLSDGRPVIVTEWLKRPENNIGEILPYFKANKIGAVNWGFVSGKSGSIWPWSSRNGRDLDAERAQGNVINPGEPFPEPDIWFHDLLRMDKSAYNENEILVFKQLKEDGTIGSIPIITKSEATESSFKLSWNAVESANSYEVFVDGKLSSKTNENSALVTDLEFGKSYFIEVWAKSAENKVLAYGFKNNESTLSSPAALLAQYKFENNTQNELNQEEANAFGNPSYSEGTDGKAILFDGTDDYVTIDRLIGVDFSVAFWINTTQTGGNGAQWWSGYGLIDCEMPGSQNDFGISLNDGKIAFGIGKLDMTIKSTVNINDGNWHHVAVTRSALSGEMLIYIDGKPNISGNGPTGEKTAPQKMHFGNLQTNSKFFKGLLDEINIYSGILKDEEVLDLYKTIVASTNSLRTNSIPKVYPNPALHSLTVEMENAFDATISIFDILGRNVLSIHSDRVITNIDISGLKAGMYHIVMQQGEAIYANKVIIN